MATAPILSDAHEWAQKLPLRENKLRCMRCGVVVPICGSPRHGCKPHWEAPGSGWSDMRVR